MPEIMKKDMVISMEDFNKIAALLYEDYECIFQVDNESATYQTLKYGPRWRNLLDERGSLEQLYFYLFTNRRDNATSEQTAYRNFTDLNFFRKEKYHGDLEIFFDGIGHMFEITLLKMSDTTAAVLIRSIDDYAQSNRLELDKIDAIQENYLFSMMVNLADDTCINPNTTEISAARQDFLDIRYSDWRIMILNMFQESDRPMFLRMSSPEYIINTLEIQNNFEFELQMMNMEGRYIWVKLSFTRMKGFSRNNPRFVYTVKDINDDMLRLLNQESIIKAVEEQNARLQKADREKTKYFSSMSHEIRTPINAIMGMNEVILRESKEETIRAYANDVTSSGKYLLSIVNDILDISKIEAGKMEIVPVEYDIYEMIREINTIISARIGERPLEYITKISPDLPHRLYGDEIRITQIIINILTNAVKYTPEGQVVFAVEPAGNADGQFAIRVTVSDTGIGIKQEDMDRLFRAYERLDAQKNRNIEGTGLGMSIVVSLLEQMGSRLEVESTYGKGSVFSFVLTQKKVSSNEERSGENLSDVSDKQILIVDDTAVNLKVATALLRPYKMTVHTAQSGKICLEKLAEDKYDLIFLDYMMPEMNGVETLHAIRGLGNQYQSIPIIALTADASAGMRKQLVDHGFTEYLEKPINPKKLDEIIRIYLAG